MDAVFASLPLPLPLGFADRDSLSGRGADSPYLNNNTYINIKML